MVTCNHSKDVICCEDLGQYADYENQLYQLYLDLYINGGLSYNGNRIKMKYYPPEYNERTGFYHLICENYDHTGDENDRTPNLRRCEKIAWADEIIRKCAPALCGEIKIWENNRKGKKSLLLYCDDIRYLVVLGVRNGYYMLVSAYPVCYPNARRDLLKEYREYIKQTTPS